MSVLPVEAPSPKGDPNAKPSFRDGLRIAHELPGRVRIKLPFLRRRDLDTAHLAGLVGDLDGVRAVRVSAAAASVVVAHDGAPSTRRTILDLLAGLTADDLPSKDGLEPAPSFVPVAVRIGLIAAAAVVPGPLGAIVTWAAIAPRVLLGLRSLLSEGITVEVLDGVAVGLGAAGGNYVTALVTDTLMAGGDYLEATTVRRSEELLEHLLHPHPPFVWVERRGKLTRVDFEKVVVGDVVSVSAGDLVPVDGVVIAGTAQVNEASVTGESVPVDKEAGAGIIAGSVLESGRIRIKAERVGSETTTAHVARFIHESLAARSNTERVAEDLANRRVLVTLWVGLATAVLTRDIRRVISVFLIDYSCSTKLTAPITIRSTMSAGAKQGILIKGGRSIEELARVDTFVFDKTGTLTRGDLKVSDVVALAPERWPEDRVLALTASIEEHTSHPVRDAVVRAARERNVGSMDHADVDVVIAHGLKSAFHGEPVLIGSRHFLQDHEGADFGPHDAVADRLGGEGKLLLYIAVGGEPVGIIALTDELRPETAETMQRLRALGVRSLVMLTGDRKVRAEGLAGVLGIDTVYAELQPEEKAEIVKRLREEGRRVAFVGDGINDAPALITADVAFSMPLGADIARATADIVLRKDDLSAVADARAAAQRAMDIIHSNFNAALGINTGLFAAAATGYLSPIGSAVLHNGSTLALLVRALTAAGFRQPVSRSVSALPAPAGKPARPDA